ncbi:hypothetical protein DSL64_09585 [Dyadobacter luteus]|uniref:Capsule assembly Wzi family protein n=1 Tax=Dyadobacter luteus TaxID=2259619 RepID=A0A3D8YDD7_9BACT|nr:capsule assembly Wzi family protein [Dyadobacter luteus]REA62490.1 hypothetical protein DSL64_09585 [Dyadobacter luteus]
MKGIPLVIFFCWLHATVAFGQDSTITYNVNLQGAIPHGNLPFWLHSNTNGNIPLQGSFALGQFSLHKNYHVHNPRFFQWSAGVEAVTSVGKINEAFFSDFYIAGKAGPIELIIGQRKEFTGLADSLLTSGSVGMGSDFRPYPKIQLSTPKFFNIIPGSDFLAFKFSYSDAILGGANVQYGNISYIPDVYLHQKTLYARIGGIYSKLSLYAGFNHQAMWGGEDQIFSGGLKRMTAYNYVIFGKPWARSRVGNHFGTIDLAVEMRINTGSFLLYRQSIYEDGSLAQLSNVTDGLNGIRFKRNNRISDKSLRVNTALLEFIYTKNQGGEIFDFHGGIFGNDNYYNHYVYRQGWSYRGRSLGNPLLSAQSLLRDNLPKDPSSFTTNNRIVGLHTGLDILWRDYKIAFKGTFTQNSGTYNTPFDPPLNQFSFLLRMERPIEFFNGSVMYLNIAADKGKIYPSSTAVSVGWLKHGFLSKQ